MTHGHSFEQFPNPELGKVVPNNGSTVPVVQVSIVRDHNLPLLRLDRDESGTKGYVDNPVPLLGKTIFWFKA